MDRETFERILSRLQGHCRLLHLHVLGEPLLHPELGGFLDRCNAFGLQVNLITNGTLLQRRAEAILGRPALRQLSISLHSLPPSLGEDGLDAYFDNLAGFFRLAHADREFHLRLRLWNRDAEADHAHRQNVLRRIEALLALSDPLEGALEGKTYLQLAENISLHCAPSFEWPDRRNPDYGQRGGCLGLRNQIAVLVDGTVVPCCLDRDGVMSLGNLNTHALAELLQSERACRIRTGFAQGRAVEELCRHCSFRLRLGFNAGV
jgi:radical SAM protein with 4Fe4S-binding SPASM domain